MLEFQKVSIDKLIPYINNARTHSSEQIKKLRASIREFGFINPVIIDKNYNIIAGHGRVEASRQEGIKEVPCVLVDHLTEAQKKAYIIADNRMALDAGWNEELLKLELESLDQEGFDLKLTGFDKDELDDIFAVDDTKADDDDYNLGAGLEQEAFAKKGDIWLLGKHRLMCGDSTQEADVDKLMDGAQVDLVVTDPPYNVDYGSKAEAINKYGYKFSDRHIKNDYMPQAQFIEFLDNAFKNMAKAMKAGAPFYIWHASITVYEFEEALRLNSLKSRQQLIWVKNALVLGRQDYQWIHEPCLYGWKEGAGHYFVDDRKQTTVFEDEVDYKKLKKEELVAILEDLRDNVSTTIIHENKPSKSEEHPTMKPIKLLARLIKNSSKQGQSVLDLFGGSGSTLIASEQLNRTCYMMEFDEKYASVIVRRYAKLKGETGDIKCIRDGKEYNGWQDQL